VGPFIRHNPFRQGHIGRLRPVPQLFEGRFHFFCLPFCIDLCYINIGFFIIYPFIFLLFFNAFKAILRIFFFKNFYFLKKISYFLVEK
jgi:hypothetical protein